MSEPQAEALRLWRELLALRLPTPTCPMCAGGDWRELDESPEVGVAAVGFVCATCGFARVHSREL